MLCKSYIEHAENSISGYIMCCKTACLLNVLNLRNYKTQGNTAKIASIKQIGSGIEIWASMRLCVCLSMSEAGHRAIKGKEG